VSASPPPRPRPGVLAFATQGAGGDDEARLRALLGRLPAEFFPFARASKLGSFRALLGAIRRRPDLVVMEGTGLGGGLAVLLGRLLFGVPFVVSSGDAVGPFMAARHALLGPAFGLYERRLCGASAGFIGWSPYLAGRALTFGAPRAMTAAGWAPFAGDAQKRDEVRRRVRERFGIGPEVLVFGIAGSLGVGERSGYCYGQELVRALLAVDRPDVAVLIVGDGDGRAGLERLAGRRCHFAGRVARHEVPDYLVAMDVGSLPQSLDGVGSFRYTTKISEYLAAGLPIVTGRLPLGYDLDGDWLWRLPGRAPWEDRYVAALAGFMAGVTTQEVAARRLAIPAALPEFDRERQVARVTAFVTELLDDLRAGKAHPPARKGDDPSRPG